MTLQDVLRKLRVRFHHPGNMTFVLQINANVGRLTLVVKPLHHNCLTRHVRAPSDTNLTFEAGF